MDNFRKKLVNFREKLVNFLRAIKSSAYGALFLCLCCVITVAWLIFLVWLIKLLLSAQHLRGERLAQGQRCSIAIASVAPHTEIMPELDDADKAILVELRLFDGTGSHEP